MVCSTIRSLVSKVKLMPWAMLPYLFEIIPSARKYTAEVVAFDKEVERNEMNSKREPILKVG